MPLTKSQIDDLKINIADAKKRALPFGLCVGKKPETTMLICDKKKKPDLLAKQAKKAGDTNKVAQGVLETKGAELHFTCEGDIPGGLQRKLKEYLSAASLKFKIRIVDSSGKFLDEDGEEDAVSNEPSVATGNPPNVESVSDAKPDPLLEKWSIVEARISAALAKSSPKNDKLIVAWQKVCGVANDGKYGAALKASEKIIALIKQVPKTPEKTNPAEKTWLAESAKIAPQVETAIAKGVGDTRRLRAFWDLAQAKVAGDSPDYATALKSLVPIAKLIKEAAALSAPEPALARAATSDGGDQPNTNADKPDENASPPVAKQNTGDSSAIPEVPVNAPVAEPEKTSTQNAEKRVQAENLSASIDQQIEAYKQIIPGSANTIPENWTIARNTTSKELQGIQVAGAVVEDMKIDALVVALEHLQNSIRELSKEKLDWKQALDAFTQRFIPVERHPYSGAEPQIRPKITALKSELSVLIAKADGYEFQNAIAGLPGLSNTCDVIEALADDLSHFLAIYNLRVTLVDANKGPKTGVADIDDLQKQTEDLLDAANADSLVEKFDAGIKKLEAIPAIADQQTLLRSRYVTYHNFDTGYQKDIAQIEGLPAIITASSKDVIDGLKKAYKAAKYDQTKDYVKSSQLLINQSRHLASLKKKLEAKYNYETLLKTTGKIIADCEAHKGRASIEGFYIAWTNEIGKAKSEAAGERYVVAAKILSRSGSTWIETKKSADAYVQYRDKLDQLYVATEKMRKEPASEIPLKQVDAFITAATSQASKKEYLVAESFLNEATIRLSQVNIAIVAQGEFDKLGKDKSLQNIDKNFEAALKIYTTMRDRVFGLDEGGTLSNLISKSDISAKMAMDEAAKPVPEFDLAKAHLQDAIKQTEDTLQKVLARESYEVHLAFVKSLVAGTLAKLNVQNCIGDQIDAINAVIAQAEDLAKPDAYQFNRAEVKLAEAAAMFKNAQACAQQWPQIKASRNVIGQAIAQLAGLLADNNTKNLPALAPVLQNREKQLTDFLTQSYANTAAADFGLAIETTQKGENIALATFSDLVAAKKLTHDWTTLSGSQYAVSNLKGTGIARVEACAVEAETKFSELNASIGAGNFDGALNLYSEIVWPIRRGIAVLAEHNTYAQTHNDTLNKLKALGAERNAFVEKQVVKIEAEFSGVVAQIPKGEFIKTEAKMKALGLACDQLIPVAKASKIFETLKEKSATGLNVVKSHIHADKIQPLLTRLTGKFENAEKLAASEDFDAANRLLSGFPTICTEALLDADQIAKYKDAALDVSGAQEDGEVSPEEIKTARWILGTLEAKSNAEIVATDLKSAQAGLDQAESDGVAPNIARAALNTAIATFTAASQVLVQHKMFASEVEPAETGIGELKAHTQANFIAKDVSEIEAVLAHAVDIARTPAQLDEASKQLETVFKRIHEVRKIANDYNAYIEMRAKPDVEPRLETLERHIHRYQIKANIDTIRAKLNTASQSAATHKHDAAMRLLADVRALGVSSLVMADMLQNTVPKVDDVKAILNGPGGQDELDAMIENLEPNARKAVLRVAFDARFGCELKNFSDAAQKAPIIDGADAGPNIQRFYEVMSELPDADVAQNDSFKIFSMIEDGGMGSAYSSDKKEIIMREGDALTSFARALGSPYELGEVEADCQPVEDDPVTMFAWNTLHEVGHSVDDKLGYMDKNGASASHGGWTNYGFNVQDIAKFIAQEYEYDADYLAKYMVGKKDAVAPEAPLSGALSCSQSDWEIRRVRACEHINFAGISHEPWSSDTLSKRLEINGVVYHETMASMWVSYNIEARGRGITGYQFRAPGEWFSELYAAYHSNKLKPSHPAVQWLEKL